MMIEPSPKFEYNILKRDDLLPENIIDYYWSTVKLALLEVYNQSSELALMTEMEIRSALPNVQAKFYNNDPLNVAADLVGKELITPIERQIYLRKVIKVPDEEVPSKDELSRSRPDL